jgi:LCP family protein required for cell wall assembly
MGSTPPETLAASRPRPSRKSSASRKPNLPRKSAGQRAGAIIGGVVLAVLLAIGAYAFYFIHSTHIFSGLSERPTVANQFPGVSSMNLMIVGRDYDYTDSDQIMKTHARSDMLMVAHFDFPSQTVHFLSIPRDTRALIPGHGTHKINSAHAMGGPALCAATITKNFGIPIDHYVALDFSGFEQAIDMMHGVDMNVDKQMDYDDNWGHLHIHLKPGFQHLDGYNAMCYVRFRHSDSDMVRTKRQQALMAALKLKLLDPMTLFSLPNIVNTIDKHTDSDMTAGQKLAIADFVRTAPKENVAMETMPSDASGYYVDTNWTGAAPLIKTWFGVDPPTGTHHHHRHEAMVAEQL